VNSEVIINLKAHSIFRELAFRAHFCLLEGADSDKHAMSTLGVSLTFIKEFIEMTSLNRDSEFHLRPQIST
jgi:hypothetical protein